MKFRRKTQGWIIEGVFSMWHCIQVLHEGQWIFFGNNDGPYRFKSAAERDAKLKELKAMEGGAQ